MSEADRLREQYAEAERLMREAQRAAGADVPPSGFQAPGGERSPSPFPDLVALVDSLRGAVPPELARQLADALRELLLALRAVLDWYIARLEPSDPAPADVQDIPVE
ncbi:MAG: hypothetical protein ACRDPC_25165 [Solirubrobacteraceae bacterium]